MKGKRSQKIAGQARAEAQDERQLRERAERAAAEQERRAQALTVENASLRASLAEATGRAAAAVEVVRQEQAQRLRTIREAAQWMDSVLVELPAEAKFWPNTADSMQDHLSQLFPQTWQKKVVANWDRGARRDYARNPREHLAWNAVCRSGGVPTSRDSYDQAMAKMRDRIKDMPPRLILFPSWIDAETIGSDRKPA